MKYEHQVAACYNPETDPIPTVTEFCGGVFSLKELQSGVVFTTQAPKPNEKIVDGKLWDGTISISIVNNEVVLKFNTDYVDNYEKKLYSES